MPQAKVNGITINYNEVGSGDPLLLVMGFGMPGEAWLGSLPFLGGFRAIYFDNRGTGQSDKPEGPYTIEQMADDAAGLLRHLGISRAHVYGVSMGGMIAQELVLRHAALVRSVVLGCTMCGGAFAKLGDPAVLDELIDVVANMGKPDPAAWVERQLPLLFPPAWVEANPAIRDLLLTAVTMMPPTPPQTAQNAMAGMFGWSTYDRLPEIAAPALIVHGDADVLIPVENAHILKERIPGAELYIVPGAGHGYPAQDPVGVHAVVTEFLRRH
ncbi:alpha/beta hydrolase [Candidatus Binatia bacterium]|nr:alpha/beta hydrolase [Candidatus Binatia bacterium]